MFIPLPHIASPARKKDTLLQPCHPHLGLQRGALGTFAEDNQVPIGMLIGEGTENFKQQAKLFFLRRPPHSKHYKPPALAELFSQIAADPTPTRLLVTSGRAAVAVRNYANAQHGSLSTSYLPALSQAQFDELLWTCDLNFVRGEDSLVRAIWAGKPLIWHIYPQHDNAHHAKLNAFLDVMDAPESLRQFHRVWNGLNDEPLPAIETEAWQPAALQGRERLLAQSSLTDRLMEFVAKTR